MPLDNARQTKETGDTRKNVTGYLTNRHSVRKSSSCEEDGKLRSGHAQTFEDARINYAHVSAMPVVQMYLQMETDYYKNVILWENDQEKDLFWNTVDRGLALAQEKLTHVKDRKDRLGTYATFVLTILSSPSLEIYPMTDDIGMGLYG